MIKTARKKPSLAKSMAGFLLALIAIQFFLFIIALISVALPTLTQFFYPEGRASLWFWIFTGLGAILLCGAIYSGYKKSGWAYIFAVAAGTVLGVIFAVALMSVLIF